MVQAVANKDMGLRDAWLFRTAWIVIHELGGHGLMSFIKDKMKHRFDQGWRTPKVMDAPGEVTEDPHGESGKLLEYYLLGGPLFCPGLIDSSGYTMNTVRFALYL